MKVYRRGKGAAINLSNNDFVASGGEGKIFHKGNLAYKIYHDRAQVPPEAKLDELSILTRDNIIGPVDILLNPKKQVIGYTTAWVDGIPMCKLFVGGFRKREGVKDDHIIQLVENLKDTIAYIHNNKIIMVDGNELNYIVGKDFMTPYFIDTTCWQTPSFPATVIMPSIRDWTNKDFTELSDWFSFGVIACWLFTGAHPFRGKHKHYDSTFKDAIERVKQRVIDGVSIFNKDVRVAPNVRMGSVPGHYKDWFIRLFEQGERLPPPVAPGTIVAVAAAIKRITGTDLFDITAIRDYDTDIIWFAKVNGIEAVKTVDKLYFKGTKIDAGPTTSIVFSPVRQVPIIAQIENGFVQFSSPTGSIVTIQPPKAEELMVVEDTLYYRFNDKLVEMSMVERNDGKIIPAMKQIWNIMPNSSKLFAGVIIQNMLGKIHATFPLTYETGHSACITTAIPELDGYRIFDAKHTKKVLVVHGQKGNDYHTLIFRFEKDYKKYDMRLVECDDVAEVNMTVLDNGVAIMIPKDGLLELSSNKAFINDVKSVEDPAITSDMKLCKDGIKARFIKDKTLYQISMK